MSLTRPLSVALLVLLAACARPAKDEFVVILPAPSQDDAVAED